MPGIAPPAPPPPAEGPLTYTPGQPPPQVGQTYNPMQFQLSDPGHYTPGQIGQPNVAGYTARAFTPALGPAYTPGQTAQFQGPQSGQILTQQQQLLSQLLDSPDLLDATAIAQLKEKQKEAALQMQADQLAQAGQNAAARGVTGGGWQAGTERRIGDATRGQVLQSQREIDLAALQANRDARVGALSAAEQMLQGQSSRAIGEYGATLSGQQAREGNLQNAAQLGLQRGSLDLQAQGMGDASAQAAAANALSRGSLTLQGDTARESAAQSGFGLNLQAAAQRLLGQQAQAGENRAATEVGLQSDALRLQAQNQGEGQRQAAAASNLAARDSTWGRQQADYQNLLSSIFGQEDRRQSAQSLALQRQLGLGNLGLGYAQMGEQGRQFDQTLPLNTANIMNQILMSRLGYGVDLATLEQNGQLAMFDWLTRNAGA